MQDGTVQIHGMKFKALALVDGHERDLTLAFKAIENLGPVGSICYTLVQEQPKAVVYAMKIRIAPIFWVGLP